MHDAVGLVEVFVAAPANVLHRPLVGIESGDVGPVRIAQARVAVGDPFRHQPRRARAFLDPDGRGRPELLHLGRFSQHLLRVGGQGQQAVDRVGHLGPGQQRAHDLAGAFELGREVSPEVNGNSVGERSASASEGMSSGRTRMGRWA